MKTLFLTTFFTKLGVIRKSLKNHVFIRFFEKITLPTCFSHKNTHMQIFLTNWTQGNGGTRPLVTVTGL
jgi:hypothetical protein